MALKNTQSAILVFIFICTFLASETLAHFRIGKTFSLHVREKDLPKLVRKKGHTLQHVVLNHKPSWTKTPGLNSRRNTRELRSSSGNPPFKYWSCQMAFNYTLFLLAWPLRIKRCPTESYNGQNYAQFLKKALLVQVTTINDEK